MKFVLLCFQEMLMSAFCRESRLIISTKCVATPYFFVDANSPCKDLLFPHGPKLAQKPLY